MKSSPQKISSAQPTKLTPPFHAQVKQYNGVPTLFVNGRPTHLGMVGVNCQVQRDIAFLKTNPSSICMLWIPALCDIEEEPDYQAIAKPFHDILARFPDALLGTVIEIRPDAQWIQQHPEEMTGYDPPVEDWIQVRPGRDPDPSWASELWQQHSAEYYRKVSRFLNETFAGRVVLYQIGGGSNGENFPIVDPIRGGLWQVGDFSKPMLRWFREYLRKRYKNNAAQLRKAWSQPDVTFENAKVPTRHQRLATEWFSLRSPCNAQTADFHRAWSQCIEACSIAWAQAIKQGTDNQALVSCPMGSVLDFGINAFSLHHMIKNTYAQCLKSPYIDLFQSPSSYINRDLGYGDSSSMIPQGMLNLAGKAWLRDFDSRTSVVGANLAKDPPSVLWRNPTTPWQDVQLLKRDAGYSMLKGGAWFWQEHRDGMYSLPEHIKIAKRIEKIGQTLLNVNRSTAAGLAILTNSDSNFHLANSNRLIYPMNYWARLRHWSHAGVASEVYQLDDIKHPDFPGHKIIMVTNAFTLTDSHVQAIKKHAKKYQATVIWLMGPGLITGKKFDLNRVSSITGFKIRAVNAEAIPQLTMLASGHPLANASTPDGKKLTKFGAGPLGIDDSAATAVGPLFYVDVSKDPKATVLALSDALAEPALTVKQVDGYTSIYCAAPYIHYALLAKIAEYAKAHIYAPAGDLTHANRSMLLVNTITPGKKTYTWPRKVKCIRELYSGKVIAQNAKTWSATLKQYETKLYYAGPQ